jgi:uncharacterized repeat protein (TIGR01451 family)
MKRLVLPTLLLLLLPGFSYPQAEPEAGYHLQVLAMDETGVVLELRLTDFTIKDQPHDGVTYQTVGVPGLASLTGPGQPQLPGLGRLLGTPPGGVARIDILESESETLSGLRLFPTPALPFPDGSTELIQVPDEPPVETFALDTALYSRDALFPGALAEVGLTGQLRDQPVIQLRLYPFQYNPVRQTLKVYHRLRVQVLFAPTLGAQADVPASRPDTPYEQMLQRALLNHAALPSAAPPPRPAGSLDISTQDTTPALKIFVEENGLYQVTYEDLQNAGFNLSGVDPRHLRLVNEGSEVAIYVNGEEDGVFDPGDWLEFYGLAPVSEFTQRNVYWLTAGDGPGLRMAERDGTPTGAGSTPTAFYTTLHLEENHEYWKYLPNGEGQDHWFWERFPSAPHTSHFSFNLQNIAAIQADAFVRVSLQGRTSTEINPDHHTQILLNGTLIDEAWWDGDIAFTHEVTVSQQLFQEGNNRLTVKTPGDTGAGVDSLYFDSFDVDYWDTYAGENDQLYFTAPKAGTTTFSISNLSSEAIHVYDVSDPFQVNRLANGVVEAEGSTYRVRVEDDVASGTRYLALTAGQKRAPAGFLLDTPSSWKSPDNGADYLMITHEDFAGAVTRLADHRASQGLRVATVQITDIYDEFSHGLFTPQAVRDFLSYAYHYWIPPAPLHVLLVGDANYDYKDYLGTGNKNYVPTHLFESGLIGQTPTDNWFVSVSGDDPLPDMFIGRFSVRTLSQANTAVDKVLAYEQNPSPADWQQRALFVADDEEGFDTISEGLIAKLPTGYAPQRIYGNAYSDPLDSTPDIIEAIDQGTLIVNFIGHGSVYGWYWDRGKRIFDNWDIPDLDNGPFYPLLVTGNCNNGLFAHPTTTYALAEQFVRFEDKGGIAAWSPTGLGYASWHQGIVGALYEAMFRDYTYQLGPATTTAKIEAFAHLGWREPIEIFTLFGDPALALRVVQPHLSLNQTATPAYVHPGQLLTYTLTYANAGNELAENVVLTEIYDTRTIYQAAHPAPTGGNNVWQLGSLPAGASDTITVTVQVPETVPAGTTLLNQAVLSGAGLNSAGATAQTLVVQPGLSLTKSAAVSQIRPGQLLTYTLTYTNVGNVQAKNVVLTETYAAYTTYYAASPPPTQGDNVWQLGSLPVDGSGTITTVVQVSETAPAGDRLVNTASLGGDSVGPEQATAQTFIEWAKIYLPLIRR